ncbi:hypothetical protein PBY51_018595 [Eleginops maclovinus]|uniref:Uncharacterized protein n=1 Tax=Eleginops maclovinus TaxID=56733 RepID=A0AAN7Y8I0_ELEMC|nr:hypothetical protein PBY51_018595 [Eleginops maclovinus]
MSNIPSLRTEGRSVLENLSWARAIEQRSHRGASGEDPVPPLAKTQLSQPVDLPEHLLLLPPFIPSSIPYRLSLSSPYMQNMLRSAHSVALAC